MFSGGCCFFNKLSNPSSSPAGHELRRRKLCQGGECVHLTSQALCDSAQMCLENLKHLGHGSVECRSVVRPVRSSNRAAGGTVALLVGVTGPSGPSILISVFKYKQLQSVTFEKQVANSSSPLSSPCPINNGKSDQNFRICICLFEWVSFLGFVVCCHPPDLGEFPAGQEGNSLSFWNAGVAPRGVNVG